MAPAVGRATSRSRIARVSVNGSIGVNAVSGPSGNVKVDLTRVVIADNGEPGSVQQRDRRHRDRHGRPVDTVEQHLRVVHRGYCTC